MCEKPSQGKPLRESRVRRKRSGAVNNRKGVGPRVELSGIEKVKDGGEACEECMSLSSDSASVSTSSALAKTSL